jgi:DnaK suppressor protein
VPASSHPLSPDQRAELQQLLERRQAELMEEAAGQHDAIAPLGDAAGAEVRDAVEDGDARMQTSLELAQLRRDEDELREVRAALQRLRDGAYGRCEECDQPIPFARLQARPEARLCIAHEEAWEKSHPEAGRLLA